MPTKKNGQGKQQPYIPAGNCDRSGEYTNENNSTKQIDNIKKEFKPVMSKENYLKLLDDLNKTTIYKKENEVL